MGIVFSRRVSEPVPHTVECRDRGAIIPIPGLNRKTEDYMGRQGVVRISPIEHKTLGALQALFQKEFKITTMSPQFRICYFGANNEVFEIVESTNLAELIETPDLRFLFTYSTGEGQLLEHYGVEH